MFKNKKHTFCERQCSKIDAFQEIRHAGNLFNARMQVNRISVAENPDATISALTKVDIKPETTLIVLDEIQEVPRAIQEPQVLSGGS